MKYGDLPRELDFVDLDVQEMMFYQDMLIKNNYSSDIFLEPRLSFLSDFIGNINCEFVSEYGLGEFYNRYAYISVKNLFQQPEKTFNRPGYHSDGFMTDDINYIWYNSCPTIFNNTEFEISQDDSLSMIEMKEQALISNEISFPIKTILRLNQYNIHKVKNPEKPQIRCFIKVTFSRDKYDLKGNAINPLLSCGWEMRERGFVRNIPQKINENILNEQP